MIGKTSRSAISISAIGAITLFIAVFILFCLSAFEVIKDESLNDFIISNPLSWFIIFLTGGAALTLSIVMVIFWFIDMRYKDLRYKMAFFLYHSRIKKDDRIPLPYLARVAVCTEPEITHTLNIMIAKGELKGWIDEGERLYIHKGLTKRGMRFLMALPPAKSGQLKEVKEWALKGQVWGQGNEGFDPIEELDEVETEELPPALEIMNIDKEKIPCSFCGRMNIKDHQFCTFCGEVI